MIICFCIIILFSIILTAVGVITINRVRDYYTYTISVPEGKIRLLKDIKTDYMIMRYRAANYMMNSGDPEYIYNVANKQYYAAMESLLTNLEEYIQSDKNDIWKDKEIVTTNVENAEEVKKLVSQYTVYAEQVLELSVVGEARAADAVLKDVIPIAERTLELLDEMISISDENIALICREVNDSASASIISLISFAFVLVIVACALSFFIIQSIAKYIDQLKAAEQAAEEASHLKTAFLASMSHEMRTPMNGIIGFSELALDDNISERTRDYLEKIKYSSEGLLQIINDILDSSKIQANKMDIEHIPFSLDEVFRACIEIIEPKALKKGITLFCYAEPSIGGTLLGDPTKLRQILLNLMSNAVKFTNVGIVKLLSGISEKSEDSITIHFEVKDSGIGMSPEQIHRIFEPFMQADNSTTRKYGGTGLGLSITKNFIELMGGKLSVESTPGVGSKFSFSLTFKVVDSFFELNEDDMISNTFEKPTFNGEILVCEDNSLNQQVICDHLERVGLKTTIADNGKAGVECVQRRMNNNEPPFNLIFMDIHMPIMDGLEAAKELDKIGNKTPVVALTANIMPNDREIYQAVGLHDCLAKPFTTKELWSCLLKYILPIGVKAVNRTEQSDSDKELHNKLLSDFWKDNQNTFRDISDAVNSGDIKLATRLAHTLKGVAGLLRMTTLQQSAGIIENSLKNGKSGVTDEQMLVLEHELRSVLAELEMMISISKPEPPQTKTFDRKKFFELVEKLEPMLKIGDADCVNMIDVFIGIPELEQLVEQIESYKFKLAIETLENLKLNLED